MATEQNGGGGEARDYTLPKKDLKSVQTLVPPKKKKKPGPNKTVHTPEAQKQPGLNFVDYTTSAEALSQREPKSQILGGWSSVAVRVT